MKTNYKNIFKYFLIFILIIVLFYLLYKCNKKNIVEFFSTNTIFNNVDCSDCEVKPTDGDCVTLYDISYNNSKLNSLTLDSNTNKIDFDISLVMTNYKFCPWKPKCDLSKNFVPRYTKNDNTTTINNVTCCSGEDWYLNNTSLFKNIFYNSNFEQQCNIIKTKINNFFDINSITNDLDSLPNNYYNFLSMCNIISDKNRDNSLNGLVFRKDISSSVPILQNPNLTIQEILDRQAFLQVKYPNDFYNSQTSQTIKDIIRRTTDISINKLNERLLRYPNLKLDTQIKLSEYYKDDISYNTYKYQLVNNNLLNINPEITTLANDYLLNENQFINCLGEKKTRDLNQLLSQQQLELNENDLYQNNYFGVADDASYNAYNSNDQRLYPNEQDINMSLTLLPDVDVNSVEAGVINQYLTAINGFYEKQIQNYTGPQTHSVNDKLEFSNDNLELKKTTFFTYNDDVNNSTNNCYNSITGNEDFNWCGEEPYYKESNF